LVSAFLGFEDEPPPPPPPFDPEVVLPLEILEGFASVKVVISPPEEVSPEVVSIE
jgi:hypothetical protein